MHVGIVYIVALYVVEHFGINSQRAESFIIGRTAHHVAGGYVGDDQYGDDHDHLFAKWTHEYLVSLPDFRRPKLDAQLRRRYAKNTKPGLYQTEAANS